MSNRFQEALDKIGGIKGLMKSLGDGPPGDRWSSFKCPFCGKKSASVFKGREGSMELFQCKHDDCVTGRQAFNPVGYVGFKFGISDKSPKKGVASPAYQRLLQIAGLWDDAPRKSEKTQRVPKATTPEPVAPLQVPVPERWLKRGQEAPASEPEPNPDDAIPTDIADQGEEAAPAPSQEPPATIPPVGETNEAPSETTPANSATPPPNPEPEQALFDQDAADEGGDDAVQILSDPALDALRWFWESTGFDEADREAIWKKRGLTADTCAAFGLRSNRGSNLKLLHEAGSKFGISACVAAGLWEGGVGGEDQWLSDGAPRTNKAEPSKFFYGYGPAGERRNAKGEKERIYDWNNPILIPYFDFRRDESKAKSPAAVVTEGEFKAMALYQVLDGRPVRPDPKLLVAIRPHKHWAKGAQAWFFMGPGGGPMAVGAMPGITFCKREGETWRVRYLLDTWIEALGIRDVVVAYDNQDRSDKAIAKRFDAVVYALWLAKDLCRQGVRGRWAQIPDSERDAEGKADWDGVLAAKLATAKQEDWPQLVGNFRTEWRTWLRTSVDMRQDKPIQIRFDFDGVDIQSDRGTRYWVEMPAAAESKFRRLSYAWRMPVPGGESGAGKINTRKIARRLMAIAREVQAGNRMHIGGDEAAAHLRSLGAAYMDDIEGGYFACRPPKPRPDVKREPKPHELDFWSTAMRACTSIGDVEGAWACEMALKGKPERFSDFVVTPLYKLRTQAGDFVRVITIKNRFGEESKAVQLGGEQYSTPTRLREFINTRSVGGTWRAGERELQEVQEDWNQALAFKNVNQVCAWGWHAPANAWFASDCAIDPDGIHKPNRLGYYELKTGDWKVSDLDKEGRPYLQEPPRWEPDRKAGTKEVGQILRAFIECSHLAVGGMHAHLALGMCLCYAAAPEVFHKHHAFPGLWIHGEAQQGKTTLARWLMRLAGFRFDGRHGGVSLESSSGAGGAIVMQQFSNLPVWFEEAQGDTRLDLLRLLKDVFNRIGGAKALSTGMREILTAPMVIGQATSNDNATRTRYPHVLMAAARRLPRPADTWNKRVLTESEAKAEQDTNYQKVEAMLGDLFLVFRHLLLNRDKYAARVMAIMDDWITGPEMRGVEARTAMVRGVAIGGLQAAMEVCGVSEWEHWVQVGDAQWESEVVLQDDWIRLAFRPFLAQEARASVQELREQGEIEEFLRALITCFERGGFGEAKSDFRKYFHTKVEDFVSPPNTAAGSAQIGNWTKVILYINPDATMDAIGEYLRKQGRTLRLRKDDLRSQMSARPWFVRPAKDGERQRFVVNGVKKTGRFWAFDLDLLPEFGYRQCTDEEVQSAPADADPRRGPLYAIADALNKPSGGPEVS
ncbi:MAG: hypothetical protein IT581_06485 [Verrucomicrobiales bacterium]|nr:hypothetical protein [Verrucomicrobiales bacterium]